TRDRTRGFTAPPRGRARQIGEMGPRAPAPTVLVWGAVGRDGRQARRPDHRGGRHALHTDLRRLPHRPSHAAAGPLHRECLGGDASPDLTADEASHGMFRINNAWLAPFCRHYRDVYIRLACLPYGDIDAAVKEIYRVAGLGLRGMELSCSWDMEPMWHPCWEPLWKAVNDVKLPLHFHTFPSLPPGKLDQQKGLTRRAAFFTAVSSFQMNLINILAAVIGAAVLERYPGIRISFGESGIGWLPYALDRMDFEWEDRFRDLGLTMKPSDYWRRQCKATFQFDRIGTRMIDEMGAETLMWASDYPHTDGVWPESSKYIEEQFGHLPADVTHKITCENAGRFYGLIK